MIKNHTSFNGGPGGVSARRTARAQAAAHDRHIAPTTMQTQHQQGASANKQLLASVNHGVPPVAASPRAGVFSGKGVVAANHGGNNNNRNLAHNGNNGANSTNAANNTMKKSATTTAMKNDPPSHPAGECGSRRHNQPSLKRSQTYPPAHPA